MTDWIAAFLRSVNAKQVGEDRWIMRKFLKIFYGASVMLHRIIGSWQQPNEIIIENFDGNLKLKIDNSRSMGAAIYWTGFHEFHEFLFLHKFLTDEMVFVDVGANLGEYTLFAAKRLRHGNVLAFEPLPTMSSKLVENVNLNNFRNVEIFKYGLSDNNRLLPIHEIENEHEGLSTFFPGNLKSKSVMEVPLKVFDQELTNFNVSRIDFIKMDIEGGELSALHGLRKSIEKLKPVIMVEINQQTYRAAGYEVNDVYRFFENLSYTPFEINKQGNLVSAKDQITLGNIVFKPS